MIPSQQTDSEGDIEFSRDAPPEQIGIDLRKILKQLGDPDVSNRLTGVNRLAQIDLDEQEISTLLIGLLHDEDTQVKWLALDIFSTSISIATPHEISDLLVSLCRLSLQNNRIDATDHALRILQRIASKNLSPKVEELKDEVRIWIVNESERAFIEALIAEVMESCQLRDVESNTEALNELKAEIRKRRITEARKRLRIFIRNRFSDSEIEILFADLRDSSGDTLGETDHDRRVIRLIDYCEHRGKLKDLLQECKDQRSFLNEIEIELPAVEELIQGIRRL